MTLTQGTAARRAFIAILIAAALVRVVFSGWVVGFGAMTKGDEADYHTIATQLVSGNGFAGADGTPTARRPPGYPVLLAALYSLFGIDPVAGRVLQVILGVAVVALTAAVARRLFDARVALLAASLAALNPFLTFISGYLLTENLYLVLVLAALCVAPDPRRFMERPARAMGSAALLALATLARPTGLPLLEWVLVAALLLAAVPWRVRAVRLTAAVAVAVLLVLPWYARNASVMGGWVLTTHGGITFYQGNNPKVARTDSWRGGVAPLEVLPRYNEMAAMPEVPRDRMAWRLGGEYLYHNWREVPELVAWKFLRFWRLKSDMGLSGIRSGWWFSRESRLGWLAAEIDVGFVYALPVLALFVAGLWLTRRRWRELVFLYGIVIVHTAIAVVFFGSLRTRIPVEPVFCIFAATAATRIGSAIRRR